MILKNVTEPPVLQFNSVFDSVYGAVCCLCFVVGIVGNTTSYLYFRSKKRDISNTVYKYITLNDTIISLTVLPVGVSFLSGRSPGFLLASHVGCSTWFYVWGVSVRLSIFLVVCLCSSRTYSLIRPFTTQKIWPIHLLVTSYFLLQVGQLAGFHVLRGTIIKYARDTARCELLLITQPPDPLPDETVLFLLEICMIFTYVVPVFVVLISCALSVFAILLNKRGGGKGAQRALRQSRHKATVTILLFAVLYGVCNVPIVVKLIIQTYTVHTRGDYNDFYEFDTWPFRYYHNATWTLLLAVNSAVNPVLYFWRMCALRRHTVAHVRWLLFGEPVRRVSTSQGTALFNQRMMYTLESEANIVVRNTTCCAVPRAASSQSIQ